MNNETLTFDEWMKQLDEVAEANGFKRVPMMSWEVEEWRELYDEGLTPKQAWKEK